MCFTRSYCIITDIFHSMCPACWPLPSVRLPEHTGGASRVHQLLNLLQPGPILADRSPDPGPGSRPAGLQRHRRSVLSAVSSPDDPEPASKSGPQEDPEPRIRGRVHLRGVTHRPSEPHPRDPHVRLRSVLAGWMRRTDPDGSWSGSSLFRGDGDVMEGVNDVRQEDRGGYSSMIF